MENLIKLFAKTSSGAGSGDCYVSGAGSGAGSGACDGYGYGSGYGSGCGSGCGYGSSDGDGDGDGCGSGDGYGSGCGDGDGDGIKSISKSNVWMIDKLQTIITSVHGNIATGFILQSDLTMSPCVIVKQDNIFAHGKNAHEAFESLQQKLFAEYPVEKRIEEFKKSHPDFNKKYSAKDLFDWHNKLTGSCLMGRNSFCVDHGIDLEKDEFSVYEFISITSSSYGHNTISMILDYEKED